MAVQELSLGKLCPMMPADKRERLARAAQKYNMAAIEYAKGISEMAVFDRKYEEIKSLYMSSVAGSDPRNMKAVLDMFTEYQPVVEAVAAYFIHESVKGALACDVAEASKDVVMRPICEDTFGKTTSSHGSIKIGPYMQTVSEGTDVDLIPSAASISAAGGSESNELTASGTWKCEKEKQTLVIFGYGEFYADTPLISRVQEVLTDRVGDRVPLEVYLPQMGDLKIIKRNSALWVEDDSELDIDVTVIGNGVTGFYPIGIDLCVKDEVTDA